MYRQSGDKEKDELTLAGFLIMLGLSQLLEEGVKKTDLAVPLLAAFFYASANTGEAR